MGPLKLHYLLLVLAAHAVHLLLEALHRQLLDLLRVLAHPPLAADLLAGQGRLFGAGDFRLQLVLGGLLLALDAPVQRRNFFAERRFVFEQLEMADAEIDA